MSPVGRRIKSLLRKKQLKRFALRRDFKAVEKRNSYYKCRFKYLDKTVAAMNSGKMLFGQCTPQYVRVKRKLKEECHATLSFLGLYDYVATKIEVYNEDTGKLICVICI